MSYSAPRTGVAVDPGTTAAAELRELFGPLHGASRRVVGANEYIHQADSPADHVYYIERGEVRLHQPGPDGSSRLVQILGPGDWIGVAALAGSATCDKNAQAVTQATVVEVPVGQFLHTLERQPGAAVMFIRQVAAQLHTASHNAARFVFDDCERRILKTLVDFSRTAAASPIEGGDEVTLRITHHQLAQAIGVARETVSLALTKLRRQNLVRTGRNRLVFNPLALQEFANRNGRTQPQDTSADVLK